MHVEGFHPGTTCPLLQRAAVEQSVSAEEPSPYVRKGPLIETPRPWPRLRDWRMAISGAHVIVYSRDAEADRAFFRDVLGYPHVDAGDGWLIFKLPPAEVAIHPGDEPSGHELYFMCDDLAATMTELAANGVDCKAVAEARWGRLSRFQLPGGSDLGIYEPRHPRAIDL